MARNDTYFNRMQTLVDPNRVESVEEDNLLGLYDGLAPLKGNTPSSLDQFDAFTPPARPAPEPAPEPAPAVGAGTGSYIEEATKPATPQEIQEMYATGYPMKDVQARINRSNELSQKIIDEGGGETASRLQSTAPGWYESKKPPPSHGGWADAAQMLGGVLSAGHQQALKDPRRPMDLKAQDAKKAAMATGLSTLLSNLFTRGQTDYKANQDAALKEAQMMKTIPGTKTRAQLEYDANNKYVEQAQHARMMDDLAKNRKFNQEHIDAELNADDPQAVELRKALIASGVAPEEVNGLGRKALQVRMGTLNTNLQAGHTAGQKAADANEAIRQIVIKQKVEQDSKLNNELREEQRRRGESAVPEVEWINNTPPPGKAVEDVRELYRTKKGFIDRIDRMRALQPRIEQLAREYAHKHGLGDDIGAALAQMGPIMKWTETFGPEAQDLVNEASTLQRSIQNFIRSESYSNLGVMQKWEDLMTKVQIPTAGSITGFFRGEPAWKALRNDVERMWVDGVTAANGRALAPGQRAQNPGTSTPEENINNAPKLTVPPKQIYDPRKREVVTVPEEAPTDTSGELPTAPVPAARQLTEEEKAKVRASGAPAPAPAPAPAAPKLEAGQKMYLVTKKDGTTKPKAMTPEQAAILKKHTDVIASVEEQ